MCDIIGANPALEELEINSVIPSHNGDSSIPQAIESSDHERPFVLTRLQSLALIDIHPFALNAIISLIKAPACTLLSLGHTSTGSTFRAHQYSPAVLTTRNFCERLQILDSRNQIRIRVDLEDWKFQLRSITSEQDSGLDLHWRRSLVSPLFSQGLAPLLQDFGTAELHYNSDLNMDGSGLPVIFLLFPKSPRLIADGDELHMTRVVSCLLRDFLPELSALTFLGSTPSDPQLLLRLVTNRCKDAVSQAPSTLGATLKTFYFKELNIGSSATMNEQTWSQIKDRLGEGANWTKGRA